MSQHTPRSRAYWALRERVKAEERTCWLCHHDIDLSAPPRTPMSWSLDHVVPVSRGGDPLDRANAHAAHLVCNQRRGNRRHGAPPVPTQRAFARSQVW